MQTLKDTIKYFSMVSNNCLLSVVGGICVCICPNCAKTFSNANRDALLRS